MSNASTAMWCLAVAALVLAPGEVLSARILVAHPVDSYSHIAMTVPLMHALLDRGHEVVLMSRFPLPPPHPATFTYIPIQNNTRFKNGFDLNRVENMNPLTTTFGLIEFGLQDCQSILGGEAVQKMVRPDSGEHFDLVFTEVFYADCLLALAHRFKAPFMSQSSCPLLPWGAARFAQPSNPAHVPNPFLRYTDEMPFLARLHNTLVRAVQLAARTWYYAPREQAIVDRWLPGSPRIVDLALNTSLLLLNTHHSLSLPQPLATNVIEIGGIHIKPPKALPQAPVVQVSSSPIMPWGNGRFGNPDNPAYVPNLYAGTADEMSLMERAMNAAILYYTNVFQRLYFEPRDQQFVDKAFGPGVPPVREMARNTSLLFTNTFHALSLPRPFTTNVIEIGGVHITEPKPLPQVSHSQARLYSTPQGGQT